MRIAGRLRLVALLAATAMAGLGPVLSQPATVLATPGIAEQTGQPCATCHVGAPASGTFTTLGQAFAALPNHDADPAAAWAQVAAGRGATAPVQVPAALPRTGSARVADGGPWLLVGSLLLLAGALLHTWRPVGPGQAHSLVWPRARVSTT